VFDEAGQSGTQHACSVPLGVGTGVMMRIADDGRAALIGRLQLRAPGQFGETLP